MNTARTIRLFSILAVASVIGETVAPVLLAQIPALRPGQYELKSQWVLLGPEKMPAQTITHCYTAADLQNLGKNSTKALATGNVATQCKDLPPKQNGATVTFVSECLGESGKTDVTTAAITYVSSESYHATVTMKGASGIAANPLASATLDITGKRIGECPK